MMDMNYMIGLCSQYVSVAGTGIVVGGAMGGIVIMIDYVVTSIFSMLKGR